MPLYVYTCPTCEIEVEAMRPIAQADDPVACPVCAEPCRRGLTLFAIGAGRRDLPTTAAPPPQAHIAGCPCCRPRRR